MSDPTSQMSHRSGERDVVSAYARRAVLDDRYAWTSPGHLFLVQQTERDLLALIRRLDIDLSRQRILEIGCGNGYWLRELCTWGARPQAVSGIDLLPERIETARALCPPAVTLRAGSAADLTEDDGSVDLVLQFTVFTSIQDDALKRHIAGEMRRVLAPGGTILWYDFFRDNPRNRDVRGVGRQELRRLFPNCTVEARRVTLLPPLARVVAPLSWTVCNLLQAVPLLRTHYLATIRPR